MCHRARAPPQVPCPPIVLSDNAACTALLEARPHGLVCLLEDECSMPKPSAANLVTRLFELLGLASDLFPIYGYRKLPYMAFASLAGLGGMLTVGLMPAPATPRIVIVVGLFCIFFMVAMVDLLSESKSAPPCLRTRPSAGS